jgi:hypothetical protein
MWEAIGVSLALMAPSMAATSTRKVLLVQWGAQFL